MSDVREIRIPNKTADGRVLVFALPLLLASCLLVVVGRDRVVGWAGVVLFGGGSLAALWNRLFPGTAVLLDAAGLHDRFGTIRWSDVSDARLNLSRGRESLSLLVPRARYPERGHPHDQDSDETSWSWHVALDRASCSSASL